MKKCATYDKNKFYRQDLRLIFKRKDKRIFMFFIEHWKFYLKIFFTPKYDKYFQIISKNQIIVVF